MPLRPGRAAALLLALALGAASCKPSSLTPLGIDEQEPVGAGSGVNGVWQGPTSSGGIVVFQIGDDTVTSLAIRETAAGCNRDFEVSELLDVVDGSFGVEMDLSPGRIVIEATLAPEGFFAGVYTYEGLPSGGPCPGSGSASFTAAKGL